jgi:hypothetical protein
MQTIEPNVEWHLDAAQNRGSTSSRVILRRAIVWVLMPPLYDAPSRSPSSGGKKLAEPVDGVIVDPCQHVGEPGPFSSHR